MGVIACAPTDPIFFSHHSFVDLLFEEFRQRQSLYDRMFDYPEEINDTNLHLVGHGPFKPMIPFEPMVNMQGLSQSYTGNIWIITIYTCSCIILFKRTSHELICDRLEIKCLFASVCMSF